MAELLASALGVVHDFVGALEEGIEGFGTACARHREANAIAEVVGALAGGVGLPCGSFKTSDGGRDVGYSGIAGDDKLVSTESGDDIEFTEGAGEEVGHLLEEGGANLVAHGVVDDLEIVDVDEEDEEGLVGALGEANSLLSQDVEAAAVIQAGEFVAEGEFACGDLELVSVTGEPDDKRKGENRQEGGGNSSDRAFEDQVEPDRYFLGQGEDEGKDDGAGRGKTSRFAANAVVEEDGEQPVLRAAGGYDKSKDTEAEEVLR